MVEGRPLTVSLRLSVTAVERLVVTADKLGERDAQAYPSAISVLTGAELARTAATSVEDTAGLAPGVTFSQNTGFAQLTIRGIGTNVVFAGSDPSSAVYLDGVYLARPAMVFGDFLDLERVEVLRGPQGTLYGRNAVGGALNVITQPPSESLSATERVGIGNLQALRAEAPVSGPLVKGRLSGSAAVLRGVRDGSVRDLDHPDHPLGGDDVTAARGKLRLALGTEGELLLSGDVTHEDPTPLTYAKVLAVKPGFAVDNPEGLRKIRASSLQESRNLQYGGDARLTLRMASTPTLTSLTAYRKLDYRVLADPDISELDLAASDVHEIQHQWSEELTLSRVGQRLSWVGGLFLLADDDRQPTSIRLGGPQVVNRLAPRVEASTGAAFGQATLALTRRVSATAGLRYTHERKTIDNAGSLYAFDGPEIPLTGSSYSYQDAIEHDAWTPRVALQLRWRRSHWPTSPPRAASRAGDSTSRRRSRAAATRRSGRGATRRAGRARSPTAAPASTWPRSTPTTRTSRCRRRSGRASSTSRTRRPRRSTASSWKAPGGPRARSTSAVTWPGWTPATTSTWRWAWTGSPATRPATG